MCEACEQDDTEKRPEYYRAGGLCYECEAAGCGALIVVAKHLDVNHSHWAKQKLAVQLQKRVCKHTATHDQDQTHDSVKHATHSSNTKQTQ